ncbi:DUF547 domain-containing protein [filamentous cyanobacterium CCP5]|nr:DUF547 domain-containing protein [filamentous cyanobacterium CCP5]
MVDFAPWDRMLQDYVDDAGRVDYGRWQRESQAALDRWLAAIAAIDIDAMGQDGAIAFLLNLYNALCIRQVLQQYPIRSIRPRVLGIPNWLAFLRFFDQDLYTLNGRQLSLNGIEHGILRQRFSEPRMHFALVCASVGCPLLRSAAYWPELLPMQLEEDAHRFINNPDKVRYDPASQILYCSKIFKWYGADFLTVASSISAYINLYYTGVQPPPTAQIAYLPYSWQLNQRTSS